MITLLEHRVDLDYPTADGSTKRDSLVAFQRQSGKEVKELIDPPFPEAAHYLLAIFYELSGARQQNMNGPASISWSELKAYTELTDEPLEPWEARLLRAMDDAYLTAIQKKNKEQQK